MIVLKGAPVSQKIQAEIEAELTQWRNQRIQLPHLSVILVGEDPASVIYVQRKQEMCKKLGFSSEVITLNQNTTQAELTNTIFKLNQNAKVDGILVQLPLPNHMNTRDVLECIDASKDVDCLTERNLGKLLTDRAIIKPCTPSGIIEMFKFYGIDLHGKNIAVVGRSLIVGTPLMHLLLKENASVSIFHSKSGNISQQLKQFDIVCVAVGRAKIFKYSQFKKDAVIIDVGMNRSLDGLSGDVHNDSNDTANELKAASPVPGGVGLMTIAMLMKNTLTLAELHRKQAL
ncbi:MAG: bifunctional 5,10-methylenetetrahydrofolate dehydrogenase/5,10-methenyltetrahydrofolate cyclohydrolase [Bdellovibrionaceae bacterium]|nr:bifunctional 5,10-methylenetetrahydrofolate dehydrogenase/5,10-methenyltetrahydrofolate cyclohydrolase [Pseudobdellovibrionaceae bacterium]